MRKLFEVEHADDQYIYSAENAEEARNQHIALIVKPSEGVSPDMGPCPDVGEFQAIPDDRQIKVRDAGERGETITKSAREWADEKPGLVSTTAGY